MALPDYPITREEQYLNNIATGSGEIPPYPVTRVEQYLDYIAEHGGGGGGVGIDVIVGWKAGTTPDVTKIPAGVQVTYQGTTYTGTKAAGEATKGQIVLVALPDGTTPNLYTEYITYKDGSTYGWEAIGTTQIDLTDYPQKTEVYLKTAVTEREETWENVDGTQETVTYLTV